MRKVLNSISLRDREILNRLYVREQSQEQICAELGLSQEQFRLARSKAKSRLTEVGRKLAADPASTVIDEQGCSSPRVPDGISRNLFSHAVDTFGSARVALRWLTSDCGALNNRSPFDVILNDSNEPEVERILDCIDYGMLA
jgi:hypothetical protein